ncbi:AAA family ATPase [Streptomyces sp. NRRL S-813]|uniref:AAA family ATPase n=1 Tax=Streptomyces sp. NRRL S-813 TaxID=1463919 RepID=UPI000AF00BB5|nr:AAA family ATPase [Streptomyces sp. NRRL S-813]
MTSPLTPPTPPHRRPAQSSRSGEAERQPWQLPASGADVTGLTGATGTAYGPDGQDGQDGPGMKTEVREGAVITVAVALGGVLMGLLWLWLAPRVPLVGDVTGNTWVVYLKDSEGEQAVGVDGTFTLLALAFGVLSAVAVFLVRRRGGVPLVVALCVGSLLGAVLAWRLGVWLGPQQDVIAHAQAVGKGVTFPAPLKLGAKGALLAWPLAALVVHLGITALFGPRDPEGYDSVSA